MSPNAVPGMIRIAPDSRRASSQSLALAVVGEVGLAQQAELLEVVRRIEAALVDGVLADDRQSKK